MGSLTAKHTTVRVLGTQYFAVRILSNKGFKMNSYFIIGTYEFSQQNKVLFIEINSYLF